MKPFTPLPLTYFYMSRPAVCPYLPERIEQMVFTDLSSASDPAALHDQLSRNGFRRSQGIAYKPNCDSCTACVPVRVPVAAFKYSRNFRRVMKRNSHITGEFRTAAAEMEHYEMFRRYVRSRHSDGGMAHMNFEDYAAMVQDSPVPTRLAEFRDHNGDLWGACLTDVLDDGLSLVYSYFEPENSDDSPGTAMILWHIEEARRRGLPYIYLGYFIEQSPKMAYKRRFRPLEAYTADGWQRLPED